jgi:hypothetical protein
MYNSAPNSAPNDVESYDIPTDPNNSPKDIIPSSSRIHGRGDVIADDARLPAESLNRAPFPRSAPPHLSNIIHSIGSCAGSGPDQIERQMSGSNMIEELGERYPGHYRGDDGLYAWKTHRLDQFQQYGMQPSTGDQMDDRIQTFSTRSFTLNEALHPSTPASSVSTTVIPPPTPQLGLEAIPEGPHSTGYGGGELDYEFEETRSERDSQPPEAPGEFSTVVIRNATGQKMHQCQICRKAFPRPGALTTHMHGHSGLRRKCNPTAA